MRYIGKEMKRVDGLAKVTGRAKYAALEMPYPLENTPPANDADVARARRIFADAGVEAL